MITMRPHINELISHYKSGKDIVSWEFLNPILDGGGTFAPPPSQSGIFNIAQNPLGLGS